jgi:hypothetical protein
MGQLRNRQKSDFDVRNHQLSSRRLAAIALVEASIIEHPDVSEVVTDKPVPLTGDQLALGSPHPDRPSKLYRVDQADRSVTTIVLPLICAVQGVIPDRPVRSVHSGEHPIPRLGREYGSAGVVPAREVRQHLCGHGISDTPVPIAGPKKSGDLGRSRPTMAPQANHAEKGGYDHSGPRICGDLRGSRPCRGFVLTATVPRRGQDVRVQQRADGCPVPRSPASWGSRGQTCGQVA